MMSLYGETPRREGLIMDRIFTRQERTFVLASTITAVVFLAIGIAQFFSLDLPESTTPVVLPWVLVVGSSVFLAWLAYAVGHRVGERRGV